MANVNNVKGKENNKISVPTGAQLVSAIVKLKKEKNAVILAHFYQIPEIQDIADFVGDSLALAEAAQNVKQDIILFAGVHFMAETAKILNPRKKVLIPDMEAGCSLADSCPADKFSTFVKKNPDHLVISYINCSAEVKAMTDIICTSSNAVKIVESIPKNQKIIFAPDRNLGNYIQNITGRKMLLWDGTCEVHDILTAEAVIELKNAHPQAKIIAHPECKSVILKMADFVGSTTALLNFTKNDAGKTYIIATETGILHQMKKQNPEKEFFIVPSEKNCLCNDCGYMKLNTMEKIYLALVNEQPEIVMEERLIEKAKIPLLRMLEISKK